ncbi:Hsp70-Hsp90 organizing protein 3-like [Balamuthia mandrillaris]
MEEVVSPGVQSQQYLTEKKFLQKLFLAVKSGDLPTLRDALTERRKQEEEKEGAVDESTCSFVDHFKDAHKRTLLHFACHFGQEAVARYLLTECWANVNAQEDEREDTPLFFAVRQFLSSPSDLSLLRFLLLESSAYAAHVNKENKTVLHLLTNTPSTASAAQKEQLVQLLVQSLSASSTEKDQGEKISPEVALLLEHRDEVGTPLLHAVLHQDLELVEALLKAGADPNAPNSFDQATALAMAASMGFEEGVDLLLSLPQQQVDIERTNDEGWTALHCAADAGREEIVRKLLAHGANPNATTKQVGGREVSLTPLDMAEAKGYDRTARLLRGRTAPSLVDRKVVAPTSSPASETTTPEKQTKQDVLPEKPQREGAVDEKVTQLKNEGNKAFLAGDWATAKEKYGQAIELDPANHVLYSNRSACFLKLQDYDASLRDAQKAKQLAPSWPKGYFREGMAYFEMKNYGEAAGSFWEGLQLDPSNKELLDCFNEAIRLGKKEHQKQTNSSSSTSST